MRYQHKAERLRLLREQKERWEAEEKQRVARLPRGIKGLWHRMTGKYQLVRSLNEYETAQAQSRDAAEKHMLITRQVKERRKLQEHVERFRYEHNENTLAVRLDIGRYLEMQGKDAQTLTDKFSQKLQNNRRNDPDFEQEI